MMLELKNERIYNPFYLIDTESILGSIFYDLLEIDIKFLLSVE